MTHQEFAAILVAFVIGFLLLIAWLILWWGHDTRLDKLEEQTAGLVHGGQPQAVTDPATEPAQIPTEPMPKIDLAGGVRRPTPFPRGKHRKAS